MVCDNVDFCCEFFKLEKWFWVIVERVKVLELVLKEVKENVFCDCKCY